MEDGLSKIRSNPASASIYDKLLLELRKFADFEVETKKTSLHIVNGKAFLGVHPRKDGILINIVLTRAIESERPKKKVERVSANRYHNQIDLKSAADLDSEVIGWLKEAYSHTP